MSGITTDLPSPLESEQRTPWMAGLAECADCDNQWSAVWPLGADALECPRCASTNTERNSYDVY